MKESLKRQKLKTGIFSGSFNPVHIGHLALANYLCEYEGLDEIWFMVSPQNPLKAGTELWPDDLRLRLVELATEEDRKSTRLNSSHPSSSRMPSSA